jgi:outer membrane receptor protein involved in Fe transport
VSGVAQLGANSGDPRNRIDSNDQVLDNFSWKMNKHDVKFGFDFHRTTVTQPQFDHNFRGRLTFNNGTTGNAIERLSGGRHGRRFPVLRQRARHTFENNFGFYAQDAFRLTPHITLNYGLRWDYFGVIQEKNNLLSNITNLDAVNSTFTLTQVGQPGLSSLYNPDKKDFAPRLSIAWDMTGKGKR